MVILLLMKKIFILVVCFSLFSSLLPSHLCIGTGGLIAQTTEEDRRIEEEKRKSLQATEAGVVDEKKGRVQPIAPIDLVYFAELMPRMVTYRYDACKALVVLMGVEDKYIDLDSQVIFLKEKNFLPKKIETEFDPMKPLRKGLAAYMFCKALGIRGGICLTLGGMNERYALKELVHHGIMSSGNVKDIVGGDELVSIVMQSANYIAKKKGKTK